MRTIGEIGEVAIYLEKLGDHEFVAFLSDADIDCDGSGDNPDNDPYYQDDTSLHGPDGKALNAYEVPFVVVPPLVCQKTLGKVLGSRCTVTNITNQMSCDAVVGDVGPTRKTGEVSPECALRLGLSPNPNWGGTSERIIVYMINVGEPALIDGVQYELKSYGA